LFSLFKVWDYDCLNLIFPVLAFGTNPMGFGFG
jgi:hypothetical protein